MSRSLDPERPRNYIQERKNKKKKLILFLKFLWPQREIDRECKKKIQVPKQQDTPDKIRILSGCK